MRRRRAGRTRLRSRGSRLLKPPGATALGCCCARLLIPQGCQTPSSAPCEPASRRRRGLRCADEATPLRRHQQRGLHPRCPYAAHRRPDRRPRAAAWPTAGARLARSLGPSHGAGRRVGVDQDSSRRYKSEAVQRTLSPAFGTARRGATLAAARGGRARRAGASETRQGGCKSTCQLARYETAAQTASAAPHRRLTAPAACASAMPLQPLQQQPGLAAAQAAAAEAAGAPLAARAPPWAAAAAQRRARAPAAPATAMPARARAQQPAGAACPTAEASPRRALLRHAEARMRPLQLRLAPPPPPPRRAGATSPLQPARRTRLPLHPPQRMPPRQKQPAQQPPPRRPGRSARPLQPRSAQPAPLTWQCVPPATPQPPTPQAALPRLPKAPPTAEQPPHVAVLPWAAAVMRGVAPPQTTRPAASRAAVAEPTRVAEVSVARVTSATAAARTAAEAAPLQAGPPPASRRPL